MLTKEQLQPIFEEKYNRADWYKILHENFNANTLREPPIPVDAVRGNEFGATAYELGELDTVDGYKIGIYEVDVLGVKQIHRNKVGLRSLLQSIYNTTIDAALIVFVQGDKWRFSYVSEIAVRDSETGKRERVKTDAKRYTYLLGKGEKAKTAADRFARFQQTESLFDKGLTLRVLQDAFNVEKMSKDFFNEYRRHYGAFLTYLIGENEDGKSRGTAAPLFRTIFNGDDKKARDFVKKMLGRIVFLYFLEKKGWLGVPQGETWGNGDSEFLSNLFKDCKDKNGFYPLILQPLFHTTLNNENRPGDFFEIDPDLFNKPGYDRLQVPFLNGGLFEPESYNTDYLIFPLELFNDLFVFFDRYNFTVYEDSPDEHTVAVDPEMLGHIFENLLEDNKDKGAFYTPKEIVHYMCQQSLIEYLCTKFEAEPVDGLRNGIERFIKYQEIGGIADYEETLLQALRDVKICDPAIGSGAFPMGILLEIFHAVEILHYAVEDTTDRVWQLDGKWDPAKVKLNIIENSVYGVDIEAGAVDIARLRFWLSLVVDENNPQPLPNLDYKITVGDSLLSKFEDHVIEIDWVPENKNRITSIEEKTTNQRKLLKQLVENQKKYFNAKGTQKTIINKEIRTLKCDILINQLTMNKKKFEDNTPVAGGFAPTPKDSVHNAEREIVIADFDNNLKKLKNLKFTDDSLVFFDWKLNFPEIFNKEVIEDIINKKITNDEIGFDIVIGNPPWGSGLDTDLQALKKAYPDTTSEHTDSFKIFIDLSLRLCNVNGCSTFIIPNTILRQKRLKDVRTLLLNKQIVSIVNLGENIFEAVIAPSCIILTKNNWIYNSRTQYNDISKLPSNHRGAFLKNLDTTSLILQDDFKNNQDKEFIKTFVSFSIPVILFGDFEYFALKDVGIQCQRINVGKEARTKSDLAQRIFIDKKINDESVMYWKGRDFDKYFVKKDTGRYFRKDFKGFIKSNEIVYFNETVYNMSPKLIIRQTSDRIIAALDLNRRWFDGSVIGLIPNKKSDYNILYILGLFNSALFRWYYQELVNEEGRVFAQVKLSKVKQLPIRVIDFDNVEEKNSHNVITSIVSYIGFLKAQSLTNFSDQLLPAYFEQVMDGVVYELYFPELLKKHNREIIKFLGDLPEFSEKMGDDKKMAICKAVFDRLNDKENLVRVNLFYMNSIPEISIIEGKK